MADTDYLLQVLVILIAAVVCVFLFRRLRFEPVLGYLVAGAAIGPAAFGLVTDIESTRSLAELGVVFLLFTVGLELPFERIRVMRGLIFGLGAAQVVVSTLVIAALGRLVGLGNEAAFVIGAGLALSSTAIVLKILSARGELTTRIGRTALAVLLMQDLAVAPFLVAVIALGQESGAVAQELAIASIKALIAVLVILGLGRLLLSHLLRPIAAVREPEIFAALTLTIVLGASWLTHQAGLSMALGAFLAGMLFAGTQYRLQVAAEIQPFRGLLLGLFFVTVGMTVDISLAWREAATILGVLAVLIACKTVLVAGLARVFGFAPGQAVYLGLMLGTGGEFAFVLIGAGMAVGAVSLENGQIVVTTVAISMMCAPLCTWLGRRIAERSAGWRLDKIEDKPEAAAALSGHVIIAGFGRVGQAVAARFAAEGSSYIAVDLDPQRIAAARAAGAPVYYGDATRPEILELLHVERAKAVVVAVDNPRAALQTVALLHYVFPKLKVYARARDETHANDLRRAGAHVVVPELVATGTELAGSILEPSGAERS